MRRYPINAHIKTLETAQMAREIPLFRAGDTLLIQLKVKESSGEGTKQTTRERLQTFEGIVIARKNKGLQSSVTLHRILEGESVRLLIPLYSPLLANITVKKQGDIRRAKIYYLQHLRGKRARIKEKHIKKQAIPLIKEQAVLKQNESPLQ